MNWNLQTFFDGKFDGNEYPEFKDKKNGWNLSQYEERLNKVVTVIKEIDADIVIMEEVEKEEQLHDLANMLAGTFNIRKNYNFAFFAKDKGASIGCAVISRIPLKRINVHSMDIRTNEKKVSLRPIINFSIQSRRKNLSIFVNHWKSKSGGMEESEIWRKRQEYILAELMAKEVKSADALLACGDFNKDIMEFKKSKTKKDFILLKGKQEFEVHSPWFMKDGSLYEKGSYWYKNHWERIDHFFSAGNITIRDFNAESNGEWTYEDGHPKKYQLWNGKGYSDHLPITCLIDF